VKAAACTDHGAALQQMKPASATIRKVLIVRLLFIV